ncbi:U3 small nucleolar RNA-associated protein 6 [Tetrabaena socialis]|uniref:U3 small nucleolar RNA-associated protein 6 n=1 Tax=Tetrabaena socialis TaxID=47790 RepID=A0A2J8A647_9CHLO|nr:U3 small nucleolar RNA-associated protein 6 [Tetrabaena socialis]|eukprot:PNH07975.1 U3 small nucleolar RNA-associated protein 6 [Tetrabaena socialis]
MADTVQYLMEQMIPELEELEEKGYFTRSEVKKIAHKRQTFEYLLKRRAALKEDFYRYIEFETKLEELRKTRKQAASAKGKKGLAEVAIVRRIHFIYERATRKFRSDVGLWMRWIEACKRFKSSKQLSKVITKALQRHSAVPELWIEAARWEFDTNSNIAAARSLMQQGIRMCRTEEAIWVQYYRLELLHALKLRVRRLVLGIDQLPGEWCPYFQHGIRPGGGLLIKLPHPRPALWLTPAADGEGQDEGRSAAATRAVMQGGVARIVFKNAIEELPASLAFRARFLDVLRAFDFDFVTGLLEQVYDSIRKDFGKVEEAWDLLARRHIDFAALRKAAPAEQAPEQEAEAVERVLQQQQQQQQPGHSGQQPQLQQQPEEGVAAGAWDADAHHRACGTYEEALAAVASARMHHLYDQYLCGVLEGLMAAGEAALQAAVGVAAQLFELLQRAHSAGCCCPGTYLAWVDWAERVRQPKVEEAWDLLARRHIDFAALRKAAPAEQAPEQEAEAVERVLQQQQQQQQPGHSGQQPQLQQQPEEGVAAGAWDADAHHRACGTYEEALAAVASARMHHLYDQYLCGVLEGLMAAGEAALQAAVGVAAQLFELLQRAHSAGCCCPGTYLAWVDWAERVRQPKMALKAARKGCERFPADVSVWRRRLVLEQSLASAKQHSAQELLGSFAAALQATQPEEAAELWHMAVQALPACSPEYGRLGEMLAAACCAVARKAASGGLGQVAAVMVEKARSDVGIEAARRLYTRLLSVPAAGGDLYRCAIRLEQEEVGARPATTSGAAPTPAASSAEGRAAAKRVCNLYEAAVSAHGSSEVDLWVGYARWLVRCGKGAGQVVWRAAKELEDADAFVAAYREELQ